MGVAVEGFDWGSESGSLMDLTKEIAKTVVRIKTEMRKASFASRSEAGRYAANQRWKGQGKKGRKAELAAKYPGVDMVVDLPPPRGRRSAKETATIAANVKRLREEREKTPKQKYDFSPQDYKMVRDAMPQLSAADAKKLTQHLLDNNAFGDTSEMSNQEMSNEFALYLDDALGGGSSKSSKNTSKQEAAAVERMDLSMRSVQALEQKTLDRAAERYKTDPPSAVDKKLLDDTKKEVLDLGESAKKAIQDAFAGGGRSVTDKLGKTVASASRKVARQMIEEGLERKSPTDPAPKMTIRGIILQTKIMILNGIEAQLKEIPNALTASYDVGKARSFASRSEAGRYAANMRWKGQGQATLVGTELPGTPGSANFSRVMAITAPKLFGYGTEEVDEDTFEEAQMQIEGFVDQLREVGIENLGEKEFKQKFGSEVDSIKDTLHEMKWQSRRSMPTGPLNRAKGLQEEVAAAASKLEFTPRDRMRADAVLQAYEEQLQSINRNGSGLTDVQRRDQITTEDNLKGGRQVLEAKTRERALGVIAELDRQATKEMGRARNFRAKATGADAPRFNAMASNSEAKMYNLQSQYGGAVEVFEALFDEQLGG